MGDVKVFGAPAKGRARINNASGSGVPLFYNYRFAVVAPLDKLDAKEMKALLHAGGARLMPDSAGRTDPGVITVVAAVMRGSGGKCPADLAEAQRIQAGFKGPVVDQTWVLDSISNFSVQDMAAYSIPSMVKARLQQQAAAAAAAGAVASTTGHGGKGSAAATAAASKKK